MTMQATVDKIAFLKLLADIKEASAIKATLLPAFALVRLDASAGHVRGTCFNGSWTFGGSIPSNSMDMWTTHVPVSTLIELVNTMENGPLDLIHEENQLTIRSLGAKAILRASPDDLPVCANASSDDAIALTGKAVKHMGRVLTFTSAEDTRPLLMHMHLVKADDTHLSVEGADGFQAGRTSVEVAPNTEKLNILVPAAFFGKMIKVIEDGDQVRMWTDGKGRHITFTVAGDNGRNYTFHSALGDGNFPDLDQILNPLKPKTKLGLDPAHLERSAKRALVFKDDKHNNTIVFQAKYTLTGMKVRCQSTSEEIGETTDTLTAAYTEGQDVTFALNAKLLQETLEAVDEPPIWEIVSGNAPIVARCPKTGFVVITMPLHLDEAKQKIDLFADEATPVALPVEQVIAPVAA